MTDIQDVTGWPSYEEEHVGSKRKLWLIDQLGVRWLFKYPRPGTGEHWAERIAAEVAGALGIPHAEAKLAYRGSDLGSISRDFTRSPSAKAELVLGNTLLATALANYDSEAQKPRGHTVDAALDLLRTGDIARPRNVQLPHGVATAADTFVGYLMLDALVGNTDRHHENWGLLVRRAPDFTAVSQHFAYSGPHQQFPMIEVSELAPTFDHASSHGS